MINKLKFKFKFTEYKMWLSGWMMCVDDWDNGLLIINLRGQFVPLLKLIRLQNVACAKFMTCFIIYGFLFVKCKIGFWSNRREYHI